MKASIAKCVVTPPAGVDLTGYIGRPGASTKAHDDLFVTVLVLDDGTERVGIISIDILGTDLKQDTELRKGISKATGIKAENLLIASSHTHAGPAIGILRGCGEPNDAYLRKLWSLIIETAKSACDDLADARLSYIQAESELALNRRAWVINSGTQQSETSGVITDPQISALLIEIDGREPVLLYNYACHGVVMGGENVEISADWIGAARDTLESSGSVGVSMFLQGCCGNINPRWRGTFDEVLRAGKSVADPLLAALPGARPLEDPKIKVRWKFIDLPYMPLPDQESLEQEISFRRSESAKARAEGQSVICNAHEQMANWAQDAIKVLSEGGPKSVQIGLQAIAIDGVVLTTLPGEAFCEYGLWFREMTEAKVIPVGYANGNIGYIPTAEAYNEGGYEVTEAVKYYGVQMIGPESEKIIVDAARDMLQGL